HPTAQPRRVFASSDVFFSFLVAPDLRHQPQPATHPPTPRAPARPAVLPPHTARSTSPQIRLPPQPRSSAPPRLSPHLRSLHGLLRRRRQPHHRSPNLGFPRGRITPGGLRRCCRARGRCCGGGGWPSCAGSPRATAAGGRRSPMPGARPRWPG
uniref:Uncharacterized protein n=1 Tax=Aegilops tauschii subsp. strangulata TaxID=200361 RepID=A0A453FM99_AEGTS